MTSGRRRRPFVPTPLKALVVVVLAALVTAASASARRSASLTISGNSTIQAGQTASFTVTLHNATGPATVSLSSTSSKGTFSTDSTGSNTVTSVTIYSTTATFYYTDTTAGSPTLTAVASGSFRGSPSVTTQVSVTAGAVNQISLSPTSSTISTNGQQQYTVTGTDQYGNSTGDVTGTTSFAITSPGSCSANTCSASTQGQYTVTASYTGLTATASLAVAAPSAATCQQSGPGSYTVTLCLSPGSGSTVSGNQNVEATVTLNGATGGTAKVLFNLDGQYLLTDFQYSSYTRDTTANTATYVYDFTLPSADWVDGSHTLDASAIQRDGFTSTPTSVALNFSNGISKVPPPPTGFTPTPGTNPAPGSPFVLAAVGDGAGGESGATDVTNMIASWNPNLFLYLGDVYEKGTSTEFYNWYGTSGGAFFGQFDPFTDPTVGNHEYTAGQAPGYFSYWHTPPDWYSLNTHGWHLVSLNSNLDGSTTSAQYKWLQSDLNHNKQACTLVYFHHPLFNIGTEPVPARFTAIWPLLAQYGVDIVLNGHDHDYQRWVPMDGNGNYNPAGPTEFVVGTGGHSLQSFVSSDPRVANSDSGSFGAMQLDLNPGGASYQYMTTTNGAVNTVDSGTIACNPNGSDSTPPSTPTGLNATTVAQTQISPGLVNLTWNASTDNVAVAQYKIFRNGNLVGTVGPQTSFSDDTVAPGTTYSYTVQALDASGNASGQSNPPLSVTTPSAAAIFSDGFESGDLSNWDTGASLTVESTDTYTGGNAAEAIGNGNPSFAYKTLPSPQANIYYQLHFKLVSLSSSSVYLGWLRTANPAPSGAKAGAIIGLFVRSATGKLGLYDNITGSTISTNGPVVTDGNWHTLQVHADIATGQVETWLDGSLVPNLSATSAGLLGTDPVGIIQLGESSSGKTFDVRFDDVTVDTIQIPYGSDTAPPSTPTGLSATTSSGLVNLTWNASTDNVGVASYNIFRDGSPVGTVASPQTSFADNTVSPNTTYSYTVQALDTSGNTSGQSNPLSVTTPSGAGGTIFSDGFESGGLSNWDTGATLSVESMDVYAGSNAAEAIGTGSPSFAYKTLPSTLWDVYYQLHFKVVSQTGSGTTYLGWLRNGSVGAILGFFVNNKNGHLGLRDQAVPTSITNGPSVNDGAWHTLQVHANILTGQVETWLDGSPVSALTTTFSTLGSNPVGIIQLGENASGKTFDVRFDDVAVDTTPIP